MVCLLTAPTSSAQTSEAELARRGFPVPARETNVSVRSGPAPSDLYRDGTWEEFAPPERSLHAAIFDPVRSRLLVFGGVGECGEFQGGVWSYDLRGHGGWSLINPDGDPPQRTAGLTAVYDAKNDRVVTFGGFSSFLGINAEVWILELRGSPRWHKLQTLNSPPARWFHSAVYDPVHQRMIAFGGRNSSGLLGDLWILDLGDHPEWVALVAIGPAPSARNAHSAVYDPEIDSMILLRPV